MEEATEVTIWDGELQAPAIPISFSVTFNLIHRSFSELHMRCQLPQNTC